MAAGVAALLSASTVFVFLGWQGANIPVLVLSAVLLVLVVLPGRRSDTPAR